MYDLYIFLKLSSDDLSVGKIAIQSHTYPFPGSLYSANNGVDRNTDTCTRTRAIGYGPQLKLCFGLWILKEYTTYTVYILKMVTVAVCTRTTPKTLQKINYYMKYVGKDIVFEFDI